MQPAYHTRPKVKLLAICATLIVIAGLVVLADHLKNSSKLAANTSSESTAASVAAGNDGTTTTTSSSNSSAPATSTYADGTYTARSDYYVPNGYENIQLTLTIKNGVVTNSNVINSEGDPESARFQQEFTTVYKSYVVGKNAGDIHLSYIAGASDTTQGFNDALSQILSKAQA